MMNTWADCICGASPFFEPTAKQILKLLNGERVHLQTQCERCGRHHDVLCCMVVDTSQRLGCKKISPSLVKV